MKNRLLLLMLVALNIASSTGQTLSDVESAEYDPINDRWLVSNGDGILWTDDLGESWNSLGNAMASHGMEVLGNTLFAIHGDDIVAYDINTGETLGSVTPNGAGFLNGMGSETSTECDFLVVSDFSTGRLLKVDVTNPDMMTVETLVDDTGTTPNGVTIRNGVATVVNWGGNSSILQVDLATGDLTTLIANTGLGNCDGVDWSGESLVVSSWSPQRITLFSPDAAMPGTWISETLTSPFEVSNPADLSVNTSGNAYAVACSGDNTVFFGSLEDPSSLMIHSTPEINIGFTDDGLHFQSESPGLCLVRGMDLSGRTLGEVQIPHSGGDVEWTWAELGAWSQAAVLMDVRFQSSASQGLWRDVVKAAPIR